MAKKACKLSYKNPWDKNSVELLGMPECLSAFDFYTIRFHDSTNMHLDYAVGNLSINFCIDFIVPRTLHVPAEYRRHEYLGMQGKILPSRTTSMFKPNLPARSEKFQLRFMPVHPVDVLSSPRGMVQEIEAGTYGGGEWFVVESGKAFLTRDGSRVVLQLGNRSFYMTMGSYHLLIGR